MCVQFDFGCALIYEIERQLQFPAGMNKALCYVTLKMRSVSSRKSNAGRQDGSKTDIANYLASAPSWTLWIGQLFNNATRKPDWRCFLRSTMASSPSAPATCQNQQAADVARGRTTTTAMTSPPAGHKTGRCQSS